MSRAAYMREYRRRKKGEPAVAGEYRAAMAAATTNAEKARIEVHIGALMRALEHVKELEQEVARLKRELAARPVRNSFQQLRPVPKPTRK